MVALAAFAVLLTGCAEKTQGSPSPGEEPTGSTATTEESTEAEPTSDEPSGGDGLAALQPCDLLDDSEAASLQLTEGEELELGGARVCEYRRQGASLNESFTVSLALWDDQGLDDLNAANVSERPNMGGHEVVSFVDDVGACGIGIAVGDSSRVDSTAIGGDQQLGCQLGEQVATIVEPKLP